VLYGKHSVEMPINGFQRPQSLVLVVCCSRAWHLRPQCRTGSRIGKHEVLIKVQEMARSATKMRYNGKQHAKSRNGWTKVESEVVLADILDLW